MIDCIYYKNQLFHLINSHEVSYAIFHNTPIEVEGVETYHREAKLTVT